MIRAVAMVIIHRSNRQDMCLLLLTYQQPRDNRALPTTFFRTANVCENDTSVVG